MNEITPVRTVDLMPTVAARAAEVAHVPRTWGRRFIVPVPLDRQPPEPAVLARMDEELAMGQMPASGFPDGRVTAAKYGTMLLESFPMKDNSGELYADVLHSTLMECPPDYLPIMTRQILRTMTYRPSVAEVATLIEAELSRREQLQARVQAAQRYWAWQAELAAAAAAGPANPNRVSQPPGVVPLPGRRFLERQPPPKPQPKASYVARNKIHAEIPAVQPEKPGKPQ